MRCTWIGLGPAHDLRNEPDLTCRKAPVPPQRNRDRTMRWPKISAAGTATRGLLRFLLLFITLLPLFRFLIAFRLDSVLWLVVNSHPLRFCLITSLSGTPRAIIFADIREADAGRCAWTAPCSVLLRRYASGSDLPFAPPFSNQPPAHALPTRSSGHTALHASPLRRRNPLWRPARTTPRHHGKARRVLGRGGSAAPALTTDVSWHRLANRAP